MYRKRGENVKFKYCLIHEKNIDIAIVLVQSFITKAPGIEHIRKTYANTLKIEPNKIVLAVQTSNNNIDFIYGQDKIIKILNRINKNMFVWEIHSD